MGSNISLAINALASAITLASKLGVSMSSVSAAIEQARQEGEDGISDAKLSDMIKGWHDTDEAEKDAYQKRMNR